MQKINLSRASELVENMQGKKIAVIGDVMLDRYFWGNVSRISPEAPVPVIDIEHETYHLGGAANVAGNLRSLGIDTLLCGMIGNDPSGDLFKQLCHESKINPDGLYIDHHRPTTVKTRIIGNNQQIARLDRETRGTISPEGEKSIISIIEKQEGLCGIIFEDYNKGTLTNILIREVIAYARANDIAVFVDPKFDNFFSYKGVTVFKPNKKEAHQALNLPLDTEDQILVAGMELLNKLKCKYVLLTMGGDGMMLFNSDGEVSSVTTRARTVADVSGAGDTVIATLAAFYCGGGTIKEASTIANNAAAIVVEKPGIVSITVDELLDSIEDEE